MRMSFGRALVAILPVTLVACGPDTTTSPTLALSAAADHSGLLALETLVVCKEGSSASFEVAYVGGEAPTSLTPSFTLNAGECAVVAQGLGTKLTVTELVTPAFTLDHVHVTTLLPKSMSESDSAGPSVSITIGNDQGHELTYYNVPTPPPPPPPGGEGCTPGYWKQPQHFDSWNGYTPSDRFGDIFAASPLDNLSLLAVLKQGGGGIKALGRHTAAALLNAANAGVASGLTTADVIAAFNAAVASGDIEGQKNIFADLNEQGCPLN